MCETVSSAEPTFIDGFRFGPEERPTLQGTPFLPALSQKWKIAYGVVGACTGIAATFGNGLVTANVADLPGNLGLYLAETSWLPGIYVAMSATANLVLIKARTQIGVPTVTHGLLVAYVLIALLQIPFPGFITAALTRALSGVTAAGLTTVTIFYMMQAFPPPLRPLSLVCGIGFQQLGSPLARLVPLDVLAIDHWHGLHLIEPAVALSLLALMKLVPLPPSERHRVFEGLDIVTVSLLVPAALLFCEVLGVGRVYWWSDAPFLGMMLLTSLPLFAGAMLVEAHRRQPLLQISWLTSEDIVRFAIVALLVRLALTEQTYGSVGLLTLGGLINDQLQILFGLVVLAMILGIMVACLTLSHDRIRIQVAIAALIIASGALLDSHSTSLTRPPELYLSQSLIGFGTTLFIGPALVLGFMRMTEKGSSHLVSFIVMFNITQNVGGLAGSALLGSYQVIQAHAHAESIAEQILGSDPDVVERIQLGSNLVANSLSDPILRNVEGGALLNQSVTQQANILAYNDVFILVAITGVLTASYLLWRIVWLRYEARRNARLGAAM